MAVVVLVAVVVVMQTDWVRPGAEGDSTSCGDDGSCAVTASDDV